MAIETVKVLAQADPAVSVETDFYTVPKQTSTVISSIVIANRGGASADFRVSISLLGANTTNKDFLYFDIGISARNTFTATLGVTMAATDVMRVETDKATVSFNLFGVEILV